MPPLDPFAVVMLAGLALAILVTVWGGRRKPSKQHDDAVLDEAESSELVKQITAAKLLDVARERRKRKDD